MNDLFGAANKSFARLPFVDFIHYYCNYYYYFSFKSDFALLIDNLKCENVVLFLFARHAI